VGAACSGAMVAFFGVLLIKEPSKSKPRIEISRTFIAVFITNATHQSFLFVYHVIACQRILCIIAGSN
jgi:hypothetical protein